jgi:hypothetical protein
MLCPSHSIPGTQCTSGWVGLRTGMDKCGTAYPTGVWTLKWPVCSELIYILHYSSPCFLFCMVCSLNTDSIGCVNINLESFLVCQVQKGQQLTQIGGKVWSNGFHSRQEENMWKTHVKCRKTRLMQDWRPRKLFAWLAKQIRMSAQTLKMPQNCSICIHYKTTVIQKLYDTDHKGRLHLVNLYFH